MDRLRKKCSTIMISIGDQTLVYHSVDEIPPHLREKLIESTHGIHSATILIADKGGREEILSAIRDRPGDTPADPATPSRKRGRFYFTWAGLGRILVLASLAYLMWVVISLR